MKPLAHIRKIVFCVTQAEMASIVRVSQGTISRWEAGIASPDTEDMRRIRAAATRRKLDWDDRWFFEAPEIAEAAE
jgi:transcriptional regulator with XRE-family HTH domain